MRMSGKGDGMTLRFAMFVMDDYYPNGGPKDCIGSSDQLEVAMAGLSFQTDKLCKTFGIWDLERDEWHTFKPGEGWSVAPCEFR